MNFTKRENNKFENSIQNMEIQNFNQTQQTIQLKNHLF
jgi:hypothetical protein